jgi:hypothetical protein
MMTLNLDVKFLKILFILRSFSELFHNSNRKISVNIESICRGIEARSTEKDSRSSKIGNPFSQEFVGSNPTLCTKSNLIHEIIFNNLKNYTAIGFTLVME